MANLKDIRTRIDSVNSTRQITSAMKMVSAAKLKRAQDRITRIRPYAKKLQGVLRSLAPSLKDASLSTYTENGNSNRILIIPVTSNRGLCGAFNSSILKETKNAIEKRFTYYEDHEIDILCIGKKGEDLFKAKNYNIIDTYHDIFNDISLESCEKLANSLVERIANDEYYEIFFVYNVFKNAAVQTLTVEQFLPINSPYNEHEDVLNYIYEPNQNNIVEEVIPLSLKTQLFKILLDSEASEHGARMTAMHQATDNAGELLSELKLTYNKARQAAITNELSEIVSGAAALKG